MPRRPPCWPGPLIQFETTRTHSGLISAFSLHLVKGGKVPIELGRALNRVEEIRLMADYRDCVIDTDQATWAVAQAENFVALLQRIFSL